MCDIRTLDFNLYFYSFAALALTLPITSSISPPIRQMPVMEHPSRPYHGVRLGAQELETFVVPFGYPCCVCGRVAALSRTTHHVHPRVVLWNPMDNPLGQTNMPLERVD
jgi:hypothetical protein